MDRRGNKTGKGVSRQTNRQVYLCWTDRRGNKFGKGVSRQVERLADKQAGIIISVGRTERETRLARW